VQMKVSRTGVQGIHQMQKRIIASLNLHDGKTVDAHILSNKLKNNDAIEVAMHIEELGVDEILLNDVKASQVGRSQFLAVVARLKTILKVPVIVAGAIRSSRDITPLRSAGCDKILITSAAVKDPDFVRKAVEENGSHRILVGLEPKHVQKCENQEWEVHINGGRISVGLGVIEWAKTLEQLGVGELVLTFTDVGRFNHGFNFEITRAVSEAVKISVCASGDPGCFDDIQAIFQDGKASSVLLTADMSGYLLGSREKLRKQVNST